MSMHRTRRVLQSLGNFGTNMALRHADAWNPNRRKRLASSGLALLMQKLSRSMLRNEFSSQFPQCWIQAEPVE